jgi:hypothetical protein
MSKESEDIADHRLRTWDLDPKSALNRDKLKKLRTPRKICVPIFNRASFGRCQHMIEELALRPHNTVVVAASSALLWQEFQASRDTIEGIKNVEFVHVDTKVENGNTHLDMARHCGSIPGCSSGSKLSEHSLGAPPGWGDHE